METRANYTAIGFLSLIFFATVLAMGFWFSRYNVNTDMVPLDVRIQGSVSGLGPGSLVQFNGINVGRVNGLSLDENDPRVVIVHTEIRQDTPIRSDTRANIGIRGLSGGAFVQLEGGSPAAANMIMDGSSLTNAPVVEGDPAALTDLLVRINGIATRTEQVMDTLESFVRVNNSTVTKTFENAETFTRALADNSDGVAKFMSGAGDVAESLQQLSSKLDGSITRVEEILNAVDPQQVNNTVTNIEAFSKSLSDQTEQITALVEAVNKTASQLDGFSNNLNKTLEKVDGIVTAVDPETLKSTLQSVDKTAKQAAKLAEAIAADQLQSAVKDVSEAAGKTREILDAVDVAALGQGVTNFNKASTQAAGLLETIDQSKVTEVVEDVTTAARNARGITEDVAKVTGPLGQRSGQIEQIISDTTQFAAGAKNLVSGIDQESVRGLISGLNATSKDVSELLASIDAAKINTAVDNISSAAQGAQNVIADVSKVTEPLGRRSGDVENILNDISQLASRLNESSKKVDGLLDQANGVLGGGEGQGLLDDARQTLAEFRRTARNLNAQISSVANNVNSFTRRGLGDAQGLIRDARQSLNRIDRVMRNLENNPSALITGAGGSRVRESSGRRPRR